METLLEQKQEDQPEQKHKDQHEQKPEQKQKDQPEQKQKDQQQKDQHKQEHQSHHQEHHKEQEHQHERSQCAHPALKELAASLPHNAFAASSQWSDDDSAWRSRLAEHGWAAADNDEHPWLEWDFSTSSLETGHPTWAIITEVLVKGREFGQWVTNYTLEYTYDGNFWESIAVGVRRTQVWNASCATKLDPPIAARKLRMRIWAWHGAAAGRVGVLGCAQVDENITLTTTRSTSTVTTTTTTTTSTVTTTTVTTTTPGISLLCFSVMRRWTPEEGIIKAQLRNGIGIFACDDTVVISTARVLLGNDTRGKPVYAWSNPAPADAMGNLGNGANTNSWLNTQVFIEAFDTLLLDSKKRIWHHDWLIKADPDAVIFPDRLKWRLLSHTGQATYLVNCQKETWRLFGAVEAFSKEAMHRYGQNEGKCKNLPWHGWGEDSYMQKCMNSLGVPAFPDFTLVGDSRCWYAPCSDHSRASFHPFKDEGSWMSCWHQSVGR
jgi:hypothetical protein